MVRRVTGLHETNGLRAIVPKGRWAWPTDLHVPTSCISPPAAIAEQIATLRRRRVTGKQIAVTIACRPPRSAAFSRGPASVGYAISTP
jgi:hypothetical protein